MKTRVFNLITLLGLTSCAEPAVEAEVGGAFVQSTQEALQPSSIEPDLSQPLPPKASILLRFTERITNVNVELRRLWDDLDGEVGYAETITIEDDTGAERYADWTLTEQTQLQVRVAVTVDEHSIRVEPVIPLLTSARYSLRVSGDNIDVTLPFSTVHNWPNSISFVSHFNKNLTINQRYSFDDAGRVLAMQETADSLQFGNKLINYYYSQGKRVAKRTNFGPDGELGTPDDIFTGCRSSVLIPYNAQTGSHGWSDEVQKGGDFGQCLETLSVQVHLRQPGLELDYLLADRGPDGIVGTADDSTKDCEVRATEGSRTYRAHVRAGVAAPAAQHCSDWRAYVGSYAVVSSDGNEERSYGVGNDALPDTEDDILLKVRTRKTSTVPTGFVIEEAADESAVITTLGFRQDGRKSSQEVQLFSTRSPYGTDPSWRPYSTKITLF